MGAEDDAMAVVNNKTEVFGVENLRIVDASIMPSIVSGNLNGPTVMMAEKAAEIHHCLNQMRQCTRHQKWDKDRLRGCEYDSLISLFRLLATRIRVLTY